jgi:hypothetical protein
MTVNSVKVQELKNGQLVITLPKGLASFKKWGKGTKLVFVEDRRTGDVILKEDV